MSLKPCRECKKEVAASAKTCPHCGVARPAVSPGVNAASALITLLLVGGVAWYFFGGGLERQAATDLQNISDKVAQDAVDQYNIAARSGSAMDRCVQAGMVAAAFLQAKNNPAYSEWKVTEGRDCRAAGVPR